MFQSHIHKVKFYPSAEDFSQALLVMLVTNIISAAGEYFRIQRSLSIKHSKFLSNFDFDSWNEYFDNKYGQQLFLDGIYGKYWTKIRCLGNGLCSLKK